MQNQDHQCRLCGAYFIPFKEDIECPRCGVRATDEAVEVYLNFISELVSTMQLNMDRNGCFMPEKWPMRFMYSNVQLLMFEMFDMLEQKKPKNQKKFLKENIMSMKLDGNGRLEDHLFDISLAVLNMRKERRYGIKK
ncbi:MAG: hypothetical protein PHP62_03855 [Candidatus Moranbacteria bacterium]|nr:hypothetical protein [Candidatus Moranbacteria bacterium]